MVKKITVFCLVLAGCMVINGCQSAVFPSVKNPGKIYYLPGYSIKTPPGKGWFIGRKDETRIVFFKKFTTPTKSLMAMAVLHEVPVPKVKKGAEKTEIQNELLKLVSRIRKRPDSRYKKIYSKEWISREKSTFSIRFRTKYRDYQAKNLPKGVKYQVTEDVGILWQHPDCKNIGLTFGLSQSYLENDQVEGFNIIAEDFINNVNIEPL